MSDLDDIMNRLKASMERNKALGIKREPVRYTQAELHIKAPKKLKKRRKPIHPLKPDEKDRHIERIKWELRTATGSDRDDLLQALERLTG